MTLRVAFNATPLLSPLTGVGNYIVHLGAALRETGDVDMYSFYGGSGSHQAPAPPAGGPRRRQVRRLRDLVKPLIPFERTLWQATQRKRVVQGMRRHAGWLYQQPRY